MIVGLSEEQQGASSSAAGKENIGAQPGHCRLSKRRQLMLRTAHARGC